MRQWQLIISIDPSDWLSITLWTANINGFGVWGWRIKRPWKITRLD